MQTILDKIRKHFIVVPNIEISLEANPETLRFDAGLGLLEAYREAGVNRLSLGCQSFDDNVLKALGRVHDAKTNDLAFSNARKAGFSNINIDLIFAVPGQSMAIWKDTLKKTLAFGPEHIALYNLTTDHGTIPAQADEDLDLAMYRTAIESLEKAGYKHYEISNFAKLDFECQHNLTYWRNEPYLGLGEGAISSTTADDYAMTVVLGLRLLIEGVNGSRFQSRFGFSLFEKFSQQIARAAKLGLLLVDDEKILLSSRGLEVANQVFELFI